MCKKIRIPKNKLKLGYTFFSAIIFVEARCSYSKMIKISHFAHTLPLFYVFRMHFRMSTFIYNNSMIRNLASSWVTSPDGRKSEPGCSYKVCSYIKKCIYISPLGTGLDTPLHNIPLCIQFSFEGSIELFRKQYVMDSKRTNCDTFQQFQRSGGWRFYHGGR